MRVSGKSVFLATALLVLAVGAGCSRDVPVHAGNTLDFTNDLASQYPDSFSMDISYEYSPVMAGNGMDDPIRVGPENYYVYRYNKNEDVSRAILVAAVQSRDMKDFEGGIPVSLSYKAFIGKSYCIVTSKTDGPAARFLKLAESAGIKFGTDVFVTRYVSRNELVGDKVIEVVTIHDLKADNTTCAEIGDLIRPKNKRTADLLSRLKRLNLRTFEVMG